MTEQARWVNLVMGEADHGVEGLMRLRKSEERWTADCLVLVADHIDSATLKAASPTVTMLQEIANALPLDEDAASSRPTQVKVVGDTLSKAVKQALNLIRPEPVTEPEKRPKLGRPDGTDPDGYYALVARAFADAVRRGDSPAAALAIEADVPIATARGWIREARRRGLLAPGRRKKPVS